MLQWFYSLCVCIVNHNHQNLKLIVATIRLVELVWKALLQSLESSSVVPNAVYLEGAKLAYL